MLKKCKVVMLPTNKKADLYLGFGGNLFTKPMQPKSSDTFQHLYFLSDEEIKEGDWFIRNNEIHQCHKIYSKDVEFKTSIDSVYCGKNTFWDKEYCKKIIATTNNKISINLGLERWKSPLGEHADQIYTRLYPFPQPSQSFLEVFVKEYNKGNVISSVLVEYEEY